MNRTLPVWQIFTKALTLVWEKRDFALRISWPVALATVLLAAVMLRDSAPVYWSGSNRPDFPSASLPRVTLVIAQSVLMLIIAVYWHRNILLQETLAPQLPLRFDAPLWRYIGYALALGLITLGIVLFAVFVLSLLISIGLPKTASGLLAAVLAMGLLLIPFRCSLVLPAAAVGRTDIRLGHSWTLTRGNTLRLLALQLLLVAFGMVTGLVLGILRRVLDALIGGSHFLLKIASNFVINLTITLIAVCIVSLCYVYLVWELPDDAMKTKG